MLFNGNCESFQSFNPCVNIGEWVLHAVILREEKGDLQVVIHEYDRRNEFFVNNWSILNKFSALKTLAFFSFS